MTTSKDKNKETMFYQLDVAGLPDELFQKEVPASKWLERAVTTTDPKGFPPNTLNQLSPLDKDVERERVIGISLWMIGNVLPFLAPMLAVGSLWSVLAFRMLQFVILYVGTLYGLFYFYFRPKFLRRFPRSSFMSKQDIKGNQYLYTERNTSKYLSLRFVWPKSVADNISSKSKPVIFCTVPHGVAPIGITAYPVWSKLFNDKLCHWTCAPVILQLPIVSFFMKSVGYVPAKAKSITDTLTKKEENIGIILDGIAGMFQQRQHEEIAHIRARKGIVKIALRAGVPIVPVYGFGHTSLYRVVVDPFGILEFLSAKLQVALTPFFGRWGWFLGPPVRKSAVCLCLGEPVDCPQMDDPSKEDIDKYHKQLLEHYEQVFDQHKAAYGWEDKKLKFA